MNYEKIGELLKNCRAQPGLVDRSLTSSFELGDYAEFLEHHNGVEGFTKNGRYIILWNISEIEALNHSFNVSEFLSNITLIGTNGGDTAYGIDKISGNYVSTPLIGMSSEETRVKGQSLEEFLDNISSKTYGGL